MLVCIKQLIQLLTQPGLPLGENQQQAPYLPEDAHAPAAQPEARV
jgi:hypothetical protein